MIQVALPSAKLSLEKKAAKQALRQAGRELVGKTRQAIRKGQGSGRSYVVNGKLVQASAPGQAPVGRSGELARSVSFKVGKGGLRGVLRARAYYAKMLETGAQGGGRKGVRNSKRKTASQQTNRVLLPRPFLSRVAKDEQRSIQSRVALALAKGIQFQQTRT